MAFCIEKTIVKWAPVAGQFVLSSCHLPPCGAGSGYIYNKYIFPLHSIDNHLDFWPYMFNFLRPSGAYMRQ